MNPSLFDRIGGEAVVNSAIDVFGRKLLTDERLTPFLEGVDTSNEAEMTRLAGKLKAFLTMATGGQHKYTGEDMRSVHAPLVKQGLSDMHFDAVLELIGETLAELGVHGDLIAEAAAVAEASRSDVLCK